MASKHRGKGACDSEEDEELRVFRLEEVSILVDGLCGLLAPAVCVFRFLPPSCDTFVKVPDPEVEPEAQQVDKWKSNKQLDLVSWIMAWDRFAIAASMTKMIGFGIAARYKQASAELSVWVWGLAICVCFVQVVLDIAIAAAAEFRPTSLAVVYDELLRKEVENKADQLGQSWDFTVLFTHVDDNTLRQARRQAVCLLVVVGW